MQRDGQFIYNSIDSDAKIVCIYTNGKYTFMILQRKKYSLVLAIELKNWISLTLELWKLGNFGSLAGIKGGFVSIYFLK